VNMFGYQRERFELAEGAGVSGSGVPDYEEYTSFKAKNPYTRYAESVIRIRPTLKSIDINRESASISPDTA